MNPEPVVSPYHYRKAWHGIGFLMLLVTSVAFFIPIPAGAITFSWEDKIAHVVIFAGLALWFTQVYRVKWQPLVLLVLYAGGVEIIQGFTSYRSMDALDFVADVAGMVVGVSLSLTVCANCLRAVDRALFKRLRNQGAA